MIKKLITSLGYACRGVIHVMRSERHFTYHLIAAALVIVAGWVAHITIFEWIALTVAIGLVLLAEMLNTAIERLMDLLHPEVHPQVKVIKDVAAGAVLVAAIAALIIGVMVFHDEVKA